MGVVEKFRSSSMKHNKVKDPKMPSKSNSSLHNSIASVLILAQCFALMPVSGITYVDISHIKLKLLSFRTLYALINSCGIIGMLVVAVQRYLSTGLNFGDMVTIIYFSNILLTHLLFFRIALKWRGFMQEWNAVEKLMKSYEYKPNLSRRFKVTMCIVMFLALGEHILFLSKLGATLSQCSSFQTNPLRTFFVVAFASFFSLTPFAYWKAFILEYINILGTFAWNFMDLFVMLICSAMAEKFRQINIRIANTQIHNEDFWKIIREDYNRLTNLCKSLDGTINHLVSLCLINDLFFITVQLFNTLTPLSGTIHYVYFIGSFGFLLGRTAAVSLYAAWVNDESKIMLAALFNIPSEYFGTEADRLIQQITFCPVAITGSNYFQVTRDLCLKVAGAIVTFEIILQQLGPMFLNTKSDGEDVPFCLALDE